MEKQKGSNINPDKYLDLFKGAIKKLAMAVDREMGEERYLIYFEKLHIYQIEEIQDAVDKAIHYEEYNVIPAVGKLIRYIEDERRERGGQYNTFQIESKPEDLPPGRLKELLKPLQDKFAALEKKEREERELRQKNKEKLKKQAEILKQRERG